MLAGWKNWIEKYKNGGGEWMSIKAKGDSFHNYGYIINNPRTYWHKKIILLGPQESRRIWIRNLGRVLLDSSYLGSVMWLQADVSWSCSHLKAKLGWTFKMAIHMVNSWLLEGSSTETQL